MSFIYHEYLVQLKTLLKKNWILARRNWTWLLLLTPLLIIIFLFIIERTLDSPSSQVIRHPTSDELPPFQVCQGRGCTNKDTYVVAYTPTNSSSVNDLLKHFVDQNPGVTLKGFESEELITNYKIDHDNDIQTAIVFNTDMTNTIEYKVYYDNNTVRGMDVGQDFMKASYPVMRAIDQAIIAFLGLPAEKQAKFRLNVGHKDFPLVREIATGGPGAVTTYLSPLFFFFPPTILLFIVAYQITLEKENKLRIGMQLMGLKSSMFWSSWYITSQVYNIGITLLLIIFGAIFQFSYFTNCNFFVNFVLFFLFGSAMISIAFFLSTVLSRANQAANAGVGILFIGFFLMFILGNPLILYILYSEMAPKWLKVIKWIFAILFPPFNFSKVYYDIAAKIAPVESPTTGEWVKGPGFSWKDLHEIPEGFVATPAPSVVLCYLLLQIAIYSLLTWYCDNIVPGPSESARPFYFFLLPSYWLPRSMRHNAPHSTDKMPLLSTGHGDYENPNMDPDVAQEKSSTLQRNENDPSAAIRMVNVTQIFRSNPFYEDSRKDKRAVNSIFLTINSGECFCFLGHNGAGKTTLINILNGLYVPTKGYAHIYGYDIVNDIKTLRRMMGVCPQHDILWPELTAREHLEIFAEFKGISGKFIKTSVDEKLTEVGLFSVGDDRSSSFSGGMKRRLSVAIASIGNPKVIFMDEPTTGLDPMSKRGVWELIESLKKDRVIILTTHSLEEADVLADRITIMSFGQLKCIGTPLHLKNRYGEGYRFNIVASDTENTSQVEQFVQQHLPDGQLIASNAGNLTYRIPISFMEQTATFCERLESGEISNLIKDWSISQTTLEDVFLKVTEESNFTYAHGEPVAAPQHPIVQLEHQQQSYQNL